MRFLKYEFADKAEFDTLKDLHLITVTDEDVHLISGVNVVEIGDIVITPAVILEDGETVITPAVMTGRFAVDILYQSIEPIAELEPFLIFPNPCGVHSFAGLDYLYELEYYSKFPELKPIEETL